MRSLRSVTVFPLRTAALSLFAYFVMTGYDTCGLRQAGSKLPYRKIALISFIGDTFNANAGLSAIVGSIFKIRLYRKQGVKTTTIARAIMTYTIAYWVARWASSAYRKL